MRIATMAMQSRAEPVKIKEPPTWNGCQLKKFLQKAEADTIPAVELKRIEKPDPETIALISEWELMKRETEWRDREWDRKPEE